MLLATMLSSVSVGAEDHAHHSMSDTPTRPGQAAFAALSEVVAILEADPTTDWSRVNVTKLRDHLIDMDEVLMRADAQLELTNDAVRLRYRGTGRTLDAIQRMIPAHAKMMNGHRGWDSTAAMEGDGVTWTLRTNSDQERARIKALGPFGLLTLGSHHGPHHLAMARGTMTHH
jgi:hypothetical protein